MSDVHLYIYDLSNGLAAQISVQLTGRFFKAIHHTSIVYHGREYFFGRFGVESSLPGQSPYGTPIERRLVGQSDISTHQFKEFLKTCEESYGVGKYHLLEHNCNTFSDAALQFLVHQRLDPEILSLPKDFLGTPLGVLLRPQIDAMYNVRAQPASSVLEVPSATTARTEEAYRFRTSPTLTKLFGEITTGGKNIGRDEAQREELRKCVEAVMAGAQNIDAMIDTLCVYLVSYFQSGSPAELYPGLDVVRVLINYASFTDYLGSSAGESLLTAIIDLDLTEDGTCTASRCAYLKLLCNAFSTPKIRSKTLQLLQSHGKLEVVSNATLSDEVTITELGLKAVWNYMIFVEPVDDEFVISSLAAVAECKHQEVSEISKLRRRVLDEISSKESEAIQEMAELLDL